MAPDASLASVSGRIRWAYDWSRYESPTGDVTRSSDGSDQDYTLAVSRALTNTIFFTGGVAHSIDERDGKKEATTSPFFSLRFTPPRTATEKELYNFKISFNRTDSWPSHETHVSYTTFGLGFISPEQWRRVPPFTLDYRRVHSKTEGSSYEYDSVHDSFSANTGTLFTVLETDVNLRYDFSASRVEDRTVSHETRMWRHSVAVDMNRDFMDGKVHTTANVGYSTNERTTESRSGVPVRFEQELSSSSGLAGVDLTPADGPPLPAENELTDNNTGAAVTPTIDLNAGYWNTGIDMGSQKSIHTIYLYITTTPVEITELINGTYNFGWQLYTTNDTSLTTWTLVGAPAVSYNSLFRRFEFDFAEIQARYFKVVNTAGQGIDPIEGTEIEAIGYLNDIPTSEVTSTGDRYYGGFGITYHPTLRLDMGYNINFGETRTDSDQGDSRRQTYMSHGFNAGYLLIPRYSARLRGSFSQSRGKTTGVGVGGNDSFSLSFSALPLPTVRTNATYHHSESLSDGEKISKSDSMGGSVSMKIYKGVDFRLNGNATETKLLASGTKTNTESIGWNLRVVPWNFMNIRINGSNSWTSTDGTSDTNDTLGARIYLNPTRVLSFSADFRIRPDSSERYTAVWSPGNKKVRVRMNYAKIGSTDRYGVTFGWRPAHRLDLDGSYTVSKSDGRQTDVFRVVATVRF